MTISLSYIDPGTIGDYQDLQDLVSAYLDRDDLAPQLRNFIAIAEAELNRRLRVVNMETKTIWVISGEEYPLPDDFRRMRKIHIEGSPDRPMMEISPTAAPMLFSGVNTGIPQAYWIEGRVLTLAPVPNTTVGTFRVTYWRRIPPLTNIQPVNWLLTEHPDIYVWATIREAAAYIRDPEAQDYAENRFNLAVEQLKQESVTDSWASGPLTPSTATQVRGARC